MDFERFSVALKLMNGIWAKGFEVPIQWQNIQGEHAVSWRESTALSKVNYCFSQGQGSGEKHKTMVKGRLSQKVYCNVKEARHPGQWRGLPLSPGLCQSK